jgi:hypothetical protein
MVRALLLGLLLSAPGVALGQDAEALRARHDALQEKLSRNAFGRPMHVESSDRDGVQAGDIYATLERPFAPVAKGLQGMRPWCDILLLQINVKHCEGASAGGQDKLVALVTRGPRDSVESAHRLEFSYKVAAAAADYLRIELAAPSGPLGTSDYRIRLEATPLDARRTFIHFSYAYETGFAARLAMQAYLAGAGRDKVGFSVVERRPDGQPVYVQGRRGMIERSAMRYFLAVDAYLASLEAPAPERLAARLRHWYASIERHWRQLAEEVSRDEYIAMKRRELESSVGS